MSNFVKIYFMGWVCNAPMSIYGNEFLLKLKYGLPGTTWWPINRMLLFLMLAILSIVI